MRNLKDRALLRRLRNGLAGLVQGWKRERSVRTQLIYSAAVVLALLVFDTPLPWLLAVLVLLAIGFALELVNAAIEALLDRVHPAYDAEIGAVKDMSSAAVLVVNLAAGSVFLIVLIARLD